jgi:hypothetical protein
MGFLVDFAYLQVSQTRAKDKEVPIHVYEHTLSRLASPEYMSRSDRPIPGMSGGKLINCRPGWIYERVQMGDWQSPGVPIGETSQARAIWAQTALLLTCIEIPGLYVQPDEGIVLVMDHLDARTVSHNGDCLVLKVTNPTKFSAEVRVLSENSADARKPLGWNALFHRPIIVLRSGEAKTFTFTGTETPTEVR